MLRSASPTPQGLTHFAAFSFVPVWVACILEVGITGRLDSIVGQGDYSVFEACGAGFQGSLVDSAGCVREGHPHAVLSHRDTEKLPSVIVRQPADPNLFGSWVGPNTKHEVMTST